MNPISPTRKSNAGMTSIFKQQEGGFKLPTFDDLDPNPAPPVHIKKPKK